MTSMSCQRDQYTPITQTISLAPSPPTTHSSSVRIVYHPSILLAHPIDRYCSSLLALPMTTAWLDNAHFRSPSLNSSPGVQVLAIVHSSTIYVDIAMDGASLMEDPSGWIERSQEYCGHIRGTRIVHNPEYFLMISL
jgi:hypothetical protein